MNKLAFCTLAALFTSLGSVTLRAEGATEAITSLPSYNVNVNRNKTSVHDPSIVYNPDTKYYYIFGSHMATAKTKDLQNWTWVTGQETTSKMWGVKDASGNVVQASYEDAFVTSNTKKVTVLKNGVATEVDLPNYNAKEWMTMHGTQVGGYMWAPDVIFNKKLNKWCQYLSLDGDDWGSVIVMLSADNIEGPYLYEGPVVFSGFYVKGSNYSYEKTDLELVLGDLTSLPARYNQGDPGKPSTSKWGTYWPNNIDPCVFYDDNGQLWMTYGSWSGGIFELKLDESTGLRDYTATYESDFASKGASFTSDPYFGKKIAGGYYVSGEASYIQKFGNYYYLFMTYGGLTATGGYVMRVFRSENPDGPFVDSNGVDARYTSYQLNYGSGSKTNRGEKLMASYKWNFMSQGEVAQGHNSATVGADGNYYLVYHTRFNNGNEGHQVRVHQLFLNEKDWLVAAPFEYNGETFTQEDVASKEIATADEIAGTYRFIIHNYIQDNANLEIALPTMVTLTKDGKLSGTVDGKSVSGKWSLTAGTSFITITIANTPYYGVLVEQTEDPTNIKSLCFTAMNPTSGVNIWGAKMRDEYALSYTYTNLNGGKFPVTAGTTVTGNLDLEMVEADTLSTNVDITWTSDTPELISDYGRYVKSPEEATYVNLTARMESGTHYYEKSIRVRAKAATSLTGTERTGLKAYYSFEENLKNVLNDSEGGIVSKQSAGKSPSRVEYKWREGSVLYQQEGVGTNALGYARFPNSLQGDADLTGVTVAMWVKRLSSENYNTDLFAFANSAQSQYLAFSPNTRLTFKDSNGNTMVANEKDVLISDLPVDTWAFLTVSIDADGFTVYVNGARKTYTKSNKGLTVSDGFTYQNILDFITGGNNIYFYTGMGSKSGSAGAYIDDVMLFDRSFDVADAKNLYNAANRVYDFTATDSGLDYNGDGSVSVSDITTVAKKMADGDAGVSEETISTIAKQILQGE